MRMIEVTDNSKTILLNKDLIESVEMTTPQTNMTSKYRVTVSFVCGDVLNFMFNNNASALGFYEKFKKED